MSIMKTVTLRMLATQVTLMVAYIVTRKVVLTTSVGIGDAVLKTIAYYSHQRLWNKIERARSTVECSGLKLEQIQAVLDRR
ncbi:MAG: DUF2061 domain-containing protein [Candidatus Thorarchaeota archaeon]